MNDEEKITITDDVWLKVNEVHCLSCDSTMEVDEGVYDSLDTFDEAYDEMDCCDDPTLEAVIRTDEPIFEVPDIDSQYYIAHSGQYTYTVDDDLFVMLHEAGVLSA